MPETTTETEETPKDDGQETVRFDRANPTATIHDIVQSEVGRSMKLSGEAVKVIWDTLCKGATGAELWMFLTFCKIKGLNPLIPGQAHFAAWTDGGGNRNRMIMAGIHGLRYMVARDMKDRYRQGSQKIEYDNDGNADTAIVSVWRKTGDDWHEYTETRRWQDYESLWSSSKHPAWKNWPADKFLEATEARLLRRVFADVIGDVRVPDEVVIDVGVTPTGTIVPTKAKVIPSASFLYAEAMGFFRKGGDSEDVAKAKVAKLLRAAVHKPSIADWLEADVAKGREALEVLRRGTTAEKPAEVPFSDEDQVPSSLGPDGTPVDAKPDHEPAPSGEQGSLDIGAAKFAAEPEKPASKRDIEATIKILRVWCDDLGITAPPDQDAAVVFYFGELGVADPMKASETLISKIRKGRDSEAIFKAVVGAWAEARIAKAKGGKK